MAVRPDGYYEALAFGLAYFVSAGFAVAWGIADFIQHLKKERKK